MSKTLLYRIFGVGKIPPKVRSRILQEGVVLQDEGIAGSVTFKKFRSKGKYFSWRRTWFCGSVVLTRERLLAFCFSKPIIAVAWSDKKIGDLDVQLEKKSKLCVRFEASTFQEGSSGEIEVRLSTPLARELMTQIKRRRSAG